MIMCAVNGRIFLPDTIPSQLPQATALRQFQSFGYAPRTSSPCYAGPGVPLTIDGALTLY